MKSVPIQILAEFHKNQQKMLKYIKKGVKFFVFVELIYRST